MTADSAPAATTTRSRYQAGSSSSESRSSSCSAPRCASGTRCSASRAGRSVLLSRAAAVGLVGPHVQVMVKQADVVDADLVAERLEHVQVGVASTEDAVVLAEQLGGEGEGRPPLAVSARAVEEVRVRR